MHDFNDICRINGMLFGILFLFISLIFFIFLWFVGRMFGNIFQFYDILLERGFVIAINSLKIWEHISLGGFIFFLLLGMWCMMGGNISIVEASLNKLGYDIEEVRADVDYSEKLDRFYIGNKFLVTAAASAVVCVVRLRDIAAICERTEIMKLDWHFIPIITSRFYYIDITTVWGKTMEVRCKNKASADEVMEYLEFLRKRDGYYFETSVKEPKSLLKRAVGFAKNKLFK